MQDTKRKNLRTPIRAIHAFFQKRGKISILTIVLFMVAALGYLDYVAGFEVSFSFFYLIPIAIATWYVSKNFGYLAASLSIATWVLSNWVAGVSYSQQIISFWNAANRAAIFMLLIWFVDEFKRALHHERLLAQTDYLTNIPNRREFYFQANTELVCASRSKRPISVAYIDVDSLKQINDQFGHLEGDTVLQIIAQSLLSSIRKTDTVARLGGDEFAILLPNTDQNGAKYIMDRVQEKLAEQMMETKPKATVSIGVVSFDMSPASVNELMHKSDGVLYEVKARGKNSIIFLQA